MDENNLRHYYGNFFFESTITAMFKVLSQQLQGTLTTAFERHFTIEGFMDMNQHKCQDI